MVYWPANGEPRKGKTQGIYIYIYIHYATMYN